MSVVDMYTIAFPSDHTCNQPANPAWALNCNPDRIQEDHHTSELMLEFPKSVRYGLEVQCEAALMHRQSPYKHSGLVEGIYGKTDKLQGQCLHRVHHTVFRARSDATIKFS